MEGSLEQLHQIQEICLKELQQIPSNSEQFYTFIRQLSEHLIKVWKSDSNFLPQFDAILTSITDIMDYSRKLNLQLQLHSRKLSRLYKVLVDYSNALGSDKYTNSTASIGNGINNYLYPAEEFDTKDEETDDCEYTKLLLNKIYQRDAIINAVITYIKDEEKLTFYIFDKSSPYRESVVELSKSLCLRQYNDLPPANEVFGIVLDQHIFRAVRCSNIFKGDKLDNENCRVYLLDTGEIVSLKISDNITYKLTESQKEIPGLAVQCILKISNNNPFEDINMQKETLKKLEHKNCQLKIINVKDYTLCVELVNTCQSSIETIEENSFVKKKAMNKVISKEELEILYEENLSTSNAMKAVMGHDPRDDKRICRFYNSNTGVCFKGSNCKLEHTLRQPEGWTKDTLPCTAIIENLHPIRVFDVDSIINITPTYVDRMDRFYAQINDPNEVNIPLVWNDDDIPSWKILRKPPHIYELVLSRYVDGLWYRAQVLSHDDDYKMFKVFYLDYGNHEVVDLNKLASIERSIAQLPFKAVLCRIASDEKSNTFAEDHEKNIQLLCDVILNRPIDVKVVSHYEDLFISFVNKIDYPSPDILARKGYLKANTK